MKLKIDEWIAENKFSDVVNVLLSDSSLCYKVGAYRASLLFSYLGFLTILKERLMKASKPTNFEQGYWDNLINDLGNEDKWEQAVFDETQRKEKINQGTNIVERDAVFAIKDELREQIKYWKNRRNDCAHFKDNNIDHYHVESFWAFLESNLPKITVEGGMHTLINRIKDHFNPILTPANRDATYLVQEIEHSVELTKLGDFWDAFLSFSSNDYTLNSKKKEFLKLCFHICSENVLNSVINKINENKDFRLELIDSYPELLIRFNLNRQDIRQFWKTELCNAHDPLAIYSTILRNGLIPEEEISEANNLVVNLLVGYRYSPEINDHHTLLQYSFFDAFQREILENNRFIGYQSYLWVNNRADLIFDIMKAYPTNKFFILKLIEHYSQDYCSDWLLDRFIRSLESGDTFFNNYKLLIREDNIQLPVKLRDYFN